MTREINSTFIYKNNKYKVVEDTLGYDCSKCAFRSTYCRTTSLGECVGAFRTDDKNIYFELIKE